MGLKFEMQKMSLKIKWSNYPNLKAILRISKIEHVTCLFWFVVMIEGMANSMVSIKVMENDDWLEHNNLSWFCPTQKHLKKKICQGK
jgi:hypothetical protein